MFWVCKSVGSGRVAISALCSVGLLLAGGVSAQTPPAAPTAAVPVAPAGETAAPAPAPASPAPNLSESVVVTVNDEMISSYDVVQRMRLLIVTSGIQPNDQNLPEIQQQATRSLVDEHLEMQTLRAEEKTQKFDLVASEAEIDDELADIARSNNSSASQLVNQLVAQGVSPQTLRDQLRAEISWRGWIRGRYGQRLVVGEDQIKAYQKRIEAESGKPRYQIAEIFLDATRAGGMAQAQQGAEQLAGQLQKGAPFPAVARQFSNSPSAAADGDVGWISTGEMPPEVDAALANMRPSQLSAPIVVKDGVYIIYLRDKRAGGSASIVNLKQIAIALPKDATADKVNAATAKLVDLRAKLKGCDTLGDQAAKVEGVVYGDLGEADTKDLAPAFKIPAETLAVGEISQPLRTDAGLHLVAVCRRRAGGGEDLSREQIESRLFGQELAMIAKRSLRDLRNTATIETR